MDSVINPLIVKLFISTYLEPSDLHFLCVGMNLPWWQDPCNLKDPDPILLGETLKGMDVL